MEAKIENELPTFEIFIEEQKKEHQNFVNSKIKCGIIGQSGSGKSTLINTILGQQICDTGVVETTQEMAGPFDKNGLSFYDLPGCGTIKFPIEEYIEKMNLKEFDCLILVTSNRFYSNDLYLLKELSLIGKEVFIARTKIDASIDDGKHNKPKKEENQILSECAYEIEQNLLGIASKGIFLVSSRFPDKWDLGKMLLSIESSLRGMKKQKFISEILSANKEIIDKKVKVAKKVVVWHSAMAAGNGLNPIPGFDISVDVGIVFNMNRKIINIFNLNEEAISYLDNIEGMAKIIVALKAFSQKFISKEMTIILIKKYAPQLAGKQIAKFVPFVGLAVSAAAGYFLTSMLGNKTVEECEVLAIEILNSYTESI